MLPLNFNQIITTLITIIFENFKMPAQLSIEKQNNILQLLQSGLSVREVSKRCNVGKSTVYELCLKSLPALIGCSPGRPTKLSLQNKHICVHAITAGKLKSAKEVQKMLSNNLGVDVHLNTVRNTFKEAGLRTIKRPSKPKLSAKNIKARLEFAKQYKHWTIEDWKNVIWSDETKINRFGSDGHIWSWIKDGQKLQPHQVNQTVKHGGGNIKIWGCMTAYGVGYMCQIHGTMTKELYQEILEDEFLKTIDHFQLNPSSVIFQHDNDPKHTAKVITNWLKNQEFSTMSWPAQSPDLNSIEHLWYIVKYRLNQYETPASGMVELWKRVEEIWNEISIEDCLRLIESMPRRIQAVLDSKGLWTDY
jgi:transposase